MAAEQEKPMTVPAFRAAKGRGEPLAVLTAYDFPTAKLFDEAGVDALLVGDSLAQAVQGRPHTLSVTLEHMLYHTEMVARAATRALVVGDLPFLSYQTSTSEAVRNAGRFLSESGASAVKLEGGRRIAETVAAVVGAQVPVMGHIGLTPQSIRALGRYRVARDAETLLDDAQSLVDAGAFAIVLEAVPAEVAQRITEAVAVPTIGIGAGPACDGQVLVWQDALGLTTDFQPKFVRRFADAAGLLRSGVEDYVKAVRSRDFPSADQSYE